MISIKRFLEQRRDGSGAERNLIDALTQMGRLFLDAMATHSVRGNESDYRSLSRDLGAVAREMEKPQSPMTLLGISSDAVEALETYCERTTAYFRAQQDEHQSMIAMLADTVAEISGQTDASIGRLQSIEQQLKVVSELDDIRTLRASLGDALQALREAAAEQRKSSAATVDRLRIEIAMSRGRTLTRDSVAGATDVGHSGTAASYEPLEALESTPTSYVAVFKLQRAEHIASHFGEPAKCQMLALIGTRLKTVLGRQDRLLRWKGTSFVMFINTGEKIHDVRTRLGVFVAATGQQYVEVGRKSALLSVGIDWTVFPQGVGRSLDEVFAEVDTFLSKTGPVSSRVSARR